MEVILNETVPSLGFVGDVVKVKSGYARNFLFPKGIALEANSNNKKVLEHRKRLLEVKRTALLKEAEALQAKLKSVEVSIAKTVGPEGHLYGSVTAIEIAEHLEKAGFALDRKLISIPEPIKSLGAHTVSVKLHPQVVASIAINVTKTEE